MATVSQRDKRVKKAQTGVIFKVPFFAPGVAKLPVVWDENIPTACTAGVNIRFNPGFFDSLTDSQVCTVLCHETAHCLLGHVWRAPDQADWDVWNQACDHAVNLLLKEFSEVVKARGLADPFPFPEPADSYCADPAFKGMAEEAIYGRLSRSKPPGSMPSFGQIEPPKPGVPSSGKKLAGDWDSTLIQSAKLSQGSVPAGIERLVGELVNPRVPWQELLRSWLREQCADDWDYMTPALEYDPSGFILPSLRSDRVGPVVFATDTSGSIDNTLLAQFQVEKQECLDTMRPRKLVDIYCDSAIHKVAEYVSGETIGKDAPGGGGTAFSPVWEHVASMSEPVKAIVYLTDLFGDFGADPGVPVIWVSWTKDKQAPFGVTVYAGD